MSGRPNIFLCHSSKDHSMVKEFRVHLDPLFHSSDLKIWEDSMLFAGRSWHESIQAELESSIAAIILVSPGLLDSDYVRSHEIPVFLEIAEAKKIPIYCLYLSYSVVGEISFYPSYNESSTGVRLTDYHGLNSPEKPLSDVSKRQWNKVLRDAAIQVYNDLRELGWIQASGPRKLIGFVAREPISGRRTIYVRVERRKPHPKYSHVICKDKTFAVHWHENIDIHKGDRVEIVECAPKSKTKKHELVRKHPEA